MLIHRYQSAFICQKYILCSAKGTHGNRKQISIAGYEGATPIAAGQVITRIHAIIFTAIPSLGNNMQIKNLKIGARLGMAFGLLLILMGFMTFMGIWKLQQVAHATELMDEATVKE